ncbi:hypothetical protein [Govanella unica]|uniref:Uncharacterized protein n=1 Tax=Govanella unica TaxID=2975056 RepID=A0A9X3TWG0_9PROT|nr:hypothetical protein [Govania unica]MDA5193001.1 hypothetical protein [Govania unica]
MARRPQPMQRSTGTAAAPARSGASPRPAATAAENYSGALGVLVTLIGLMCFALPTFIVFFGGMVPSWVAFIVDDRRSPYRLNVIAACNLAGVVPYLALLWSQGHSLAYAMQLLSGVYAWATMFMGAVAGFAILWVGPHLAAIFYNMDAVKQRQSLDVMRRALIEEWGPDVLPPPEKRVPDKKPATATVGKGAGEQKATSPTEDAAVKEAR